MKMSRRTALLMLASCLPVARSLAADSSNGPTTIVAPFVPGGTADVLARTIGQRLSAKYNVPFVIENKTGMGGNIGARSVAAAKPDGKTLLLGTIGIHAAYSIYRELAYDPAKELQPIIILGAVPCTIVVHPDLPFKSLDDLIAFAKANPKKLNFGSAGVGSSTHMVGELFQQAAGIELTHVPSHARWRWLWRPLPTPFRTSETGPGSRVYEMTQSTYSLGIDIGGIRSCSAWVTPGRVPVSTS